MDSLRKYYYTKVKLPQFKLKSILLLFGLLFVSIFVLYWVFLDFNTSIDALLLPPDNNLHESYLGMESKNAVMIPEYNRYIAPTITLCGGIGNMMWRYASMYGLGRQLNRTPFFESSAKCMKNAQQEALDTFPEYGKRMRFLAYNYLNTRKVDFGFHCCKAEKIDRLKDETKKFVILGGYYFQDYHYFDNVSSEIRFLFSWSTAMRQKVDTFKKFLFGLDASHKLCVHTRMGDFVKFNIHSKINFTEMALEYAYMTLQTQFRNISVVLLGQDKNFLWSVKYNKTLIPRMYVPISMSRTEDMAFASIHCDSLLITAQASTFGWWIGYLMDTNWDRSRGSIFFNSNFKDDAPSDTYDFDNFPPHWIPLRLLPTKIVVEDGQRPINE